MKNNDALQCAFCGEGRAEVSGLFVSDRDNRTAICNLCLERTIPMLENPIEVQFDDLRPATIFDWELGNATFRHIKLMEGVAMHDNEVANAVCLHNGRFYYCAPGTIVTEIQGLRRNSSFSLLLRPLNL